MGVPRWPWFLRGIEGTLVVPGLSQPLSPGGGHEVQGAGWGGEGNPTTQGSLVGKTRLVCSGEDRGCWAHFVKLQTGHGDRAKDPPKDRRRLRCGKRRRSCVTKCSPGASRAPQEPRGPAELPGRSGCRYVGLWVPGTVGAPQQRCCSQASLAKTRSLLKMAPRRRSRREAARSRLLPSVRTGAKNSSPPPVAPAWWLLPVFAGLFDAREPAPGFSR